MGSVEEESFPRGGTSRHERKHATPKSKTVTQSPTEKDLFKIPDEGRKAKKRRKGESETKPAKKQKTEPVTPFKRNTAQIELLNLRTICPGMLVLGVVRQIQDYELVVSLPSGLYATVSMTNICDSYTQILRTVAEQQPDSTQGVATLEELFQVGQLLRCKVTDVKLVKRGKTSIKLSINPKDVNNSLSATALNNGMVLCGSVISQEDHGYLIDLGIKGVHTFLSTDNAEKFIQLNHEGYSLKPGQHLHCCIQTSDKIEMLSGENRSIQVTIDPTKVASSLIRDSMRLALSSLVPGMVLPGQVEKISEEGLCVRFLSYKGGVHNTHLPQSRDSYQRQEQVKVCVLFVHPTTKSVALTLLPHLMDNPARPCSLFRGIQLGQTLEGKVLWMEKRRGLRLKLTDKVQGFCSISNLSDKEVSDIHKQFEDGAMHRCRVVNFDYVDKVAVVTMKESVLNQRFLKFTDIKVGSVVECTVRAFHDMGMSVRVTSHIKAFIPSMHIADVPLKHPEKKYSEGDKLKCRVLQLEPSKSSMVLTNKRSLINSKLPIITSFEQICRGMELEGFIACIKEGGVLVAFYNRVKGWVPKNELGSEPVPYPEKVFFLGQVIKCRVLYVAPDEGRMTLSFKLSKSGCSAKIEVLPADFEIGKVVDCRVIRKKDAGFDVVVLPSESPAYLPKMHLSDCAEHCDQLMGMYEEGDVLHDVMYLAHTNITLVTHKFSYIQASREGSLVSEFSQLQPGVQIPGTIKNVVEYGVFVEFPNNMMGLAPNKYVCDKRVPDISSVFPLGMSVNAKVVEVDTEKKRFLISLRMSDCYHGNNEKILDILSTVMLENKQIVDSFKGRKGKKLKAAAHLAELKMGQLVDVKVQVKNEFGVICQLNNGIKGFCSNQLIAGQDCEVDGTLQAVVLYTDMTACHVELSLDPDLIKAISHRKENKFSKVKEDQVIKAEVLLVRADFVLVSLKGHAAGTFAYLPVRKHLNDFLEKQNFSVGQVANVIVKSVEESLVLANWHKYEQQIQRGEQGQEHLYGIHKHNLKLGTIASALVKAVHAHQMNVILKNTPGRVHITEVPDNTLVGTFPMKKYEDMVGKRISVKIVGFREVKTHKYLPISHRHATKAIPECSVLPSKLTRKGVQPGEEVTEKSHNVGDTVTVYVDHFANNYLWMVVSPHVRGRVSVFNISHDLKIIQSPREHFKPGQVWNTKIIGKVKDGTLELSITGEQEEVMVAGLTKGLILGRTKDGDGLNVQLADHYRGRIWMTDVQDEYKDIPLAGYREGQGLQCRVLSCDPNNREVCSLSIRPSRMKPSKKAVKDADIQEWGQVKEGLILRGYVVKLVTGGITLCLGHSIHGLVPFDTLSDYYIKDPESVFPTGKVVTAKIIGLDKEHKKIDLSLLEKDTGIPEDIPTKLRGNKRTRVKKKESKTTSNDGDKKTVDTKTSAKKRKLIDEENGPKKSPVQKMKKQTETQIVEQTVPTSSNNSDKRESKQKMKQRKKLQAKDEVDSGVESDSDIEIRPFKPVDGVVQRLQLSADFSWMEEYHAPTSPAGSGELHVSSDSEGENRDAEEDQQKRPTRNKKALMKEQKEEERKLYELERLQVTGRQEAETGEDFDRLVLQSPDSSLVWLRYMAFHLETTEIEKARAVAERALRTINFREEQEKINVWVGYLNLENLYGSGESVAKLLERALQQNDPWTIYQQLVNIYIKSGKVEEAEKLYTTMMKRFSGNKEAWTMFGLFYFKHGQLEPARKLLQRSLKSLAQRDHVEVIAKFAQMEFKHGEPERGRTVFENILSNYPKRTDLWSVYVDMVQRLDDTDGARLLFERVINLKLSVKKMKFFFKKYLDFEKKHGTEETIMNVKQKAMDYVESRGFVDDL